MRPFILNYFEVPISEPSIDTAILEYDEELQVSVLKGTKDCAFDKLELGTTTMTKAENGEGSSDDDPVGISFVENNLGTVTYSAVNNEMSDSDQEVTSLSFLLGTSTQTRVSREDSDSDPF